MPVSTRQATPGPSNRNPTASQPANTRKRAGSEGHEGVRDAKKIKIEGESLSQISSASVKDKKKKKRKRKRRVSVVQSDSEVKKPERAKSASVARSPSKRKATVPSGESVPSREVKDHADDEEEEVQAILSSSDKGKRKAKSASRSPSQRPAELENNPSQPVASGSTPPFVEMSESISQASEIALLKEKLAAQTQLLERHQTHLSHQQQTLTCQICLDLMYKPYALSPCGHITCYGCLVRWFTAPQNAEVNLLAPGNANGANAGPQEPETIDAILSSATARNGSYNRRRKKCPICRAVVVERPVEMWGIKDMVSALVRSQLVDLAPIPPPPTAEEGPNNPDPWRNVFRRAGSTLGGALAAFFPFAGPAEPRAQDDADREQMGWYDAEDGGIHRCIECYHEIWDGVCSACHRHYPGHGRHNDDDDDDEEGGGGYGRRLLREMALDSDESGDDDAIDLFRFWERRHNARVNGGELEEDEDGDDDEGEDDDDDGDIPFDLEQLQQLANSFRPQPPVNDAWNGGVAQITEVDDEDENDDEDSEYGGSFIDDDEDGGDGDEDEDEEIEVVEGPSRNRDTIRRRYVHVESDSEDDNDHGEEESDNHVDLDEDGDEDDGPTVVDRGRMRRPAPRLVVDDSDSDRDTEVDVDDDHGNIDPSFYRQEVYAVFTEDEEEHSDDSPGWW